MKARAHHLTGLAAGIAAYTFTAGTMDGALLAVPAGWVGGTLPDRLEHIGRLRLLGHRTWTHWVAPWLALLVYALTLAPAWAAAMLTGLAAGGLAHWLGDLPNPRGVPLFTPFHRVSLNAWPSGAHDRLLSVLALLAAGLLWAVVRGGLEPLAAAGRWLGLS